MNLEAELNTKSIGKAIDKLKEIQQNIKEAENPKSYSLKELFPNDFMEKYTNCNTIQDFFDNSGLDFSHEANEVISSEEFNNYVASNTRFTSWEEMKNHAGKIILSNNIMN